MMNRRTALKSLALVFAPLVAWMPRAKAATVKLDHLPPMEIDTTEADRQIRAAVKRAKMYAQVNSDKMVRTVVIDHPNLGTVEVDFRVTLTPNSHSTSMVDGKIRTTLTVEMKVLETRVNGKAYPEQIARDAYNGAWTKEDVARAINMLEQMAAPPLGIV